MGLITGFNMEQRRTKTANLFFCLPLMMGLIFMLISRSWAVGTKTTNIISDPSKYWYGSRMPSLNDKGQIAFIGEIPRSRADVIFYNGNTFNNITADLEINKSSSWPSNPILNNNGQIVFHKGGDIYFYDGININSITNNLEIEPYDLDKYSYALNDLGQIVFPVSSSAGYDVYFYDGTAVTNITAGLDMDAGAPSINNSGQMAFHVYDAASNHWDIYFYNGTTLTNITAHLDISAYSPIINNKGQIALRGQTHEADHYDIYLYDGTRIVNITARVGIYLDGNEYRTLRWNNNGQLVFSGTDRSSGKTGVYFYDGTALTFISSYSHHLSLNDRGQIAFFSPQGGISVYFYDGKSIVYRGPGGCSTGIIDLNNKAQIVYETPACTTAGGQSIYFFDGTYSSNIVELPRSANFRISRVVANDNSFSAGSPDLNDLGQIAFVEQDPVKEYNDVYIYDGNKITNITADLKVHAGAPAINNSGQIAFLDFDYMAQSSNIYLYDGQGLKNITADLDISVAAPSINDQGQVAFLGYYRKDDQYHYYIYLYDGAKMTNITANLNISVIYAYQIDLNNKGQIAFWGQDSSSGRKDIYLMDIDGAKLTNITSQLEIEYSFLYDVDPYDFDLNDYGQLTFSLLNRTSGGYEVYLYDGSTLKIIPTDSNISAMRPQINNQGQIAFVGRNGQYAHIYLYNKDMVTDITPNLEANAHLSDLSLNNKGQIAIGYEPTGYDHSQYDIYFYDGREFINITYNETTYCPCSSLALNDKGQIVFSGRDSTDRTALYFYDGKNFTNIIAHADIYRYTTWLYPSLNNKGQVAFSSASCCLPPLGYTISFYDEDALKHITANLSIYVSSLRLSPSLNNNGWIAFSGSTWDESFKQISNFYLYDGNTVKNLTADLKIWATSPSLNDRGQIAFSVSTKDWSRSDIYFYDGEKFSNITAHLKISSLNPSLNNNGQIAFEGFDDATGRQDIYLYDGKQITNITAELAISTSSPVLNDYGQIAFKNWIREATGVGSPAYRILPADEIYFFDGSKIIQVIHQDKTDHLDLSLNNQGQIAFSDQYNVYLAQPNKLPIADAGTNQIATPGTVVNLDGTGSSDPDGDPISYRWLLVAKPVGSNAYLSDYTHASPTLITDLTGIYEVQLMVSDGIDESRPDEVIITAVDTTQGPVAYSGLDKVVTTASTVILNGANSYSPNEDDLAYNWSIISKPADSRASLANAYGEKWALIADVDGIYEVQLIVSNDQSVSDSDTVTIIALGKDAKIRVATNKSDYAPGDTLELYLWVGNSISGEQIKADVFIGFGLPDGRLYFFDSTLALKPSKPTNPRSFTPFAEAATLEPGFVFPDSAEMNADSDGSGKLDSYRLFSVTLPQGLPEGEYFAFAALAETGMAQKGNIEILGKISLARFKFYP